MSDYFYGKIFLATELLRPPFHHPRYKRYNRDMATNHPRWSPQAKITISILLLVLGIYLLYQFRAVIQPLILAFILAYILSPIANGIQNRTGLRRGFATALSYLVLAVVLVIIPILIIPTLTAQSAGLNLDILRILSQIE